MLPKHSSAFSTVHILFAMVAACAPEDSLATELTSDAQSNGWQLATTATQSRIYTIDPQRGAVVALAAETAQDATEVWEEPHQVAVWGGFGDFSWVYPIGAGKGSAEEEALAEASYALASDMYLVHSSDLHSHRAGPSSVTPFLPALTYSCPQFAVANSGRLQHVGSLASGQSLASRGTVAGDFLAIKEADVRLVPWNCIYGVAAWEVPHRSASSFSDNPNSNWRYGRSATRLLETIETPHAPGAELTLDAPEALPDLASRPPLCSLGPPQPSEEEASTLRQYSAEAFTLQVLSKLPVVLRQQIQPFWEMALQSPLGREWLAHFPDRHFDSTAAIDIGMKRLIACNQQTPHALARHIDDLQTTTTRSYVTKSLLQLQHTAYELRLLQAVQLLNEAGRLWEKASSGQVGYRFYRSRRSDSSGIGFAVNYFDGAQSLYLQTIPGTSTRLHEKSYAFGGIARDYRRKIYYVQLDAARLIDRFTEALAGTQREDWDAYSLQSATTVSRSRTGTMTVLQHESWESALFAAAIDEFDRTEYSDTYEVRMIGAHPDSDVLQLYLAIKPPLQGSTMAERAQIFLQDWIQHWLEVLDAPSFEANYRYARALQKHVPRYYIDPTLRHGDRQSDEQRAHFEAELREALDSQCGGGLSRHLTAQRTFRYDFVAYYLQVEGLAYVAAHRHALPCLK